jgi:type I restriction enzyme S subunit
MSVDIIAIASMLIAAKSSRVWGDCALSDVGTFIAGTGFPLEYQGHKGLKYLFCKVSDMNRPGNELAITDTENTIDEQIAERIRAKPLPTGTVIFPKIGGAIATNKRRLIVRETIVDNNVMGLVPNKGHDTLWLYFFMRGIDLSVHQTGTSVPALRQSTIGEIRIPRLPGSVQKKIGVFGDWLAKCGRPVEWGASPELPAELMEQRRIVAKIERLAGLVAEARGMRVTSTKQTTLMWQHGAAASFVKVAARCPLRQLGDLITIRGGGTPTKSDPFYWDGHIPWISPKDMKKRELSDAFDHISERATQETAAKLIDPGAVLVVVRGMILAHTFPSAVLRVPAAINQDMKALIPYNDLLPEYLCTVLWAWNPRILKLIEKSTHDTRKFETDKLLRFEIPVPPLAMQRRVLATLDALKNRTAQLETIQAQVATGINAMMPAILDRAFRGEL